ncbi:hypothetical protein H0266_18430 [Halobacillus locisalis]|uniref:Uncharacterized protein n=1 Tax=Halobacillus locisalis TaxID=220753 RepID=A0A838CY36_9BACI|nr:hypothetical protein [Halobacillus locisalis]MBA2176860.1 hypothetical protein [Halobacillus locisalis]
MITGFFHTLRYLKTKASNKEDNKNTITSKTDENTRPRFKFKEKDNWNHNIYDIKKEQFTGLASVIYNLDDQYRDELFLKKLNEEILWDDDSRFHIIGFNSSFCLIDMKSGSKRWFSEEIDAKNRLRWIDTLIYQDTDLLKFLKETSNEWYNNDKSKRYYIRANGVVDRKTRCYIDLPSKDDQPLLVCEEGVSSYETTKLMAHLYNLIEEGVI